MSTYDKFQFINENEFRKILNKNIFIQGNTGTGKSVLLVRTVNYLLTQEEKPDIYILDPKEVEIFPSLFSVQNGKDVPFIAKTDKEIERLFCLLKEKTKSSNFKETFVFVDEVDYLLNPNVSLMKNIEELSPKGVHFILFSQNDVSLSKLSQSKVEWKKGSLKNKKCVHKIEFPV